MARSFAVISLLSLTVLTTACAQPSAPAAGVPVAFPVIDGTACWNTRRRSRRTSSRGARPAARAKTCTVAYLEDQFKKAGLEPGNPDGTFIQNVPMVGIATDQKSDLSFRKGGDGADPRVPGRCRRVDQAGRRDRRVDKSEVVFVGYGVQAPEFDWDDYKGVDVKGKTLVMLINDPAVPDPPDPSQLDPRVFGGQGDDVLRALDLQVRDGREARRGRRPHRARDRAGGYPFSVVQSNADEKFDLVAPDKNLGRSAVEGWITRDAARRCSAWRARTSRR